MIDNDVEVRKLEGKLIRELSKRCNLYADLSDYLLEEIAKAFINDQNKARDVFNKVSPILQEIKDSQLEAKQLVEEIEKNNKE